MTLNRYAPSYLDRADARLIQKPVEALQVRIQTFVVGEQYGQHWQSIVQTDLHPKQEAASHSLLLLCEAGNYEEAWA